MSSNRKKVFCKASDRICIEQRLRESEERYSAIVNRAPEFIIIHKMGEIVFINDAGIKASGFEKSELIGHNVMEHLTEESKVLAIKALEKRKAGEAVNDYEIGFITKTGEIIHNVVKSVMITYENEPAILVLLVDISARKSYERQLETTIKSAEAASFAKSRFLANMSHEMRTPLNGILGFLELLGRTDLSQEQREYVLEAKSASSALLYLINDILDFSKIEAGKLGMEKKPFSIALVVQQAVSLLQSKAWEKESVIISEVDSSIPEPVIGDSIRLKQVLCNLLSNAVKFTSGGKIWVLAKYIQTKDDSVVVHFEVKDTGIGISSENIEKIFEPFVQGDASTTRKHGGTGLGLAISKELVKKMNGEIGVESNPGNGSRFYFTACFKLENNVVAKEPCMNASAKMKEIAISLGIIEVDEDDIKRPQILLVDDNEMNRKIVTMLLQKNGYGCDVAENGEEAIEAAAARDYDIIFMDCQMPVMDGYESTARIRATEKGKRHTTIIAMTANAMEGDREKCINAGMDDYISKPLKLDLVLELVKRNV